MKKKWISLIAAVLFVMNGGLSGCSCSKSGGGQEDGVSSRLGGLNITLNNAFFERSKVTEQLWLIVELTLQNNGGEEEYFVFGYASRFYIQAAGGKAYATFNAYDDSWTVAKGTITQLNLHPGETQILTLQFFDVPEDTTGLKLFCKTSAVEEGKKISIPFNPSQSEAKQLTLTEPTAEPKTIVKPVKGSPGEIVIRFCELVRLGKYTEAEQYISPNSLEYIYSKYGSLKDCMERRLKGRKIDKIEITREEIKQNCGIYKECGYVDYVIYYNDGSKDVVEDDNPLIKINGEWKLP